MDDIDPAEIELRLKRGDVVAVAYAAGQAVGCIWLAFSSGVELAFDTRWIIGPMEALRYDSFVRPEWRGRAIHSLVNDAINRCAREHGVVRSLAGISALNSQSWRLAKRFRSLPVMRLFLFHVRGVNWTYRRAMGAPLHSRFAVTTGAAMRSVASFERERP